MKSRGIEFYLPIHITIFCSILFAEVYAPSFEIEKQGFAHKKVIITIAKVQTHKGEICVCMHALNR